MSLVRGLGIARSLAIYYGQPWRWPRMDRFYGQFIDPGDLCFDVGSHVGNRIRSWLTQGARVVAVEPQPDFQSILDRLYGGNDRVILEPIGLAGEPGQLEMAVSRATPTVSTFSRPFIAEVQAHERWRGVAWDDRVTIEVQTLDQLIARHGLPRFCKIDVEGFEAEVLRGLSQALPALSVEYVAEDVEVALACIDRLESLAPYVYRTSAVETMRWTQPEWIAADRMRSFLRSRAPGSGSGDVYARLR